MSDPLDTIKRDAMADFNHIDSEHTEYLFDRLDAAEAYIAALLNVPSLQPKPRAVRLKVARKEWIESKGLR